MYLVTEQNMILSHFGVGLVSILLYIVTLELLKVLVRRREMAKAKKRFIEARTKHEEDQWPRV